MVNQSSESRQTQAFSNAYETVLPEHYRLVEMVGRGGMAEVFLGEDARLGRKVAIKFLNAEFRRDPDRVRRFRQEARSASALNHPNILTIHDIGDHNGVQFIVSEFVEGETLGTRIAQGRLPLAETIDIAMQIASALSASHAAGIVHRDIKPDNVMIRRDGVVKVLDFGLAKARGFTTLSGADFDAMTLDSGSTSPGLIVGTPQYMSPEQARGKELDGRTDIFSLGILIFEMVTRNSPFDTGSFADTMAAILTKEPKRLEEFVVEPPVRLIDLVSKCLKKDRDERFSSMAEVVRELKLLKGEEVPNSVITDEVSVIDTGQTQAVPTHRHSIRSFLASGIRERTPVTAIILVTAALLVGGWWAWDRSFQSPAPSLMRTVPITNWSSSASELVTSASFSPDGKLVAFAMRKGDSTEIWVKPVVGGDPVQVTKNGGFNHYPIWSSDGQSIAFFSDRGGGKAIWKIPFTGGEQSRIVGQLARVARPVLWAADGSIYFQDRPDLFRVSDGGSTERLTAFAEAGISPQTIAVSRDQKLIAYSAKIDGNWQLGVRPLKGGQETLIASSKEVIDYVAWHPNGHSVSFSQDVDGILQIFEGRLEAESPIQRSNGDLNYLVQDVSTNGSILYGSVSETSDLWRVNIDDSVESIIANSVPLEYWPDVSSQGAIAFQSVARAEKPDGGSITVVGGVSTASVTVSTAGSMPTWSNRGDRVAFFRRNGGELHLWSSTPDGIDASRISDMQAAAGGYMVAPYLRSDTSQVAWSPDDSKIVYSVLDGSLTKLYLSVADGSGTGRNLVTNPSGGPEREPIWSPNGQAVVFRTQDRVGTAPDDKWSYRIRMVDVASGKQTELFQSAERIRVLGFSNSGRNLVFIKKVDPSGTLPNPPLTDVYLLSISSREVKKIQSLNNAYFLNIHLSSRGDLLAYVSATAGRTSVLVSPVGGSNPRELLSINDPKIMVSSLEIAPDGSFIAFGKQTRTSLLSMLTE